MLAAGTRTLRHPPGDRLTRRRADGFRVTPARGLRREQPGNRIDEARSSVNGEICVVRRDRVDRRTDAVIGDRFEFVASGEKGKEFSSDTRFSPR